MTLGRTFSTKLIISRPISTHEYDVPRRPAFTSTDAPCWTSSRSHTSLITTLVGFESASPDPYCPPGAFGSRASSERTTGSQCCLRSASGESSDQLTDLSSPQACVRTRVTPSRLGTSLLQRSATTHCAGSDELADCLGLAPRRRPTQTSFSEAIRAFRSSLLSVAGGADERNGCEERSNDPVDSANSLGYAAGAACSVRVKPLGGGGTGGRGGCGGAREWSGARMFARALRVARGAEA